MNEHAGRDWEGIEELSPHPAREQLLMYVDGEFTEREAGRIKVHLEACWNCRALLNEIEQTIADFSRFDAAVLTPNLPPPPGQWRGFDARLKELVEESRKPSLLSRLHGRIGSLSLHLIPPLPPLITPRPAAVGTVVCLLLLIGVWISRTPRVSAQELLRLSAQDEAKRPSHVIDPIVYHRLQVRRVAAGNVDSLTLEIWDDGKRSRFMQRVADNERSVYDGKNRTPALLTELDRILAQNQMDARRPLSAAAYARWRERARPKAESVTETRLPGTDRGAGLKLVTVVEGPHNPDAIIEATLFVRGSDWHAVAQYLKVQGLNEIQEFELVETEYEVLPSQALPDLTDAAAASVSTPATSSSSRSAVPSASPSASPGILPTAVALMEAETETIYALHQARADLGEQIEVLREEGMRVVVRGLVETDARKRQLTEGLSRIQHVTVRLQSVEEVLREAGQKGIQQARRAEVVELGESIAGAAPQRSAFELRLAQYFAARGVDGKKIESRIAELFNASVTSSSSAMSEAWALRRLAERFSEEQEKEFTPASRGRIEEILAHHVARLKECSRVLHANLADSLIAIAGRDDAPRLLTSEIDWQAHARLVFKSVEQLHRHVGRIMNSAERRPEAPEKMASQLLDAMAGMDSALQSLERHITK
jgi:hypothetical protein